jgi:2-oxo-3-hexenedioate decarboxylase
MDLQDYALTAQQMLALLGTGRQIPRLSSRFPGFSLADAYVGRKIGFTNRAAWSGYGISGPIWNYMFDRTVRDLAGNQGQFSLTSFPEPRIEPEIVVHLATAPQVGMTEEELICCIDWVAHGFEIVHSVFPNWEFTAADAVAAYGVHSALLLGDRHVISHEITKWREELSSFTVDLIRVDGVTRSGHARNVLGGPLKALRFLVQELARYPTSQPLGGEEMVTTGTLTEAMPVAADESWSTRLSGIEIRGVQLQLQK